MPKKEIIHTTSAPAAIGPYSQAVRVGNTVYVSGNTPLDPVSGLVVEGDVSVQARRAFDNMLAIVEAAGGTFADVVKVGIFVTDMGDFASVNAVMMEYFDAPYPARTTVEVSGLPSNVQVEIDCILALD